MKTFAIARTQGMDTLDFIRSANAKAREIGALPASQRRPAMKELLASVRSQREEGEVLSLSMIGALAKVHEVAA